MFSSFLSLLHPPVHLRQLLEWQASRAWKNSLQTAGVGMRDVGVGGAEREHTEPVGFLRMHLHGQSCPELESLAGDRRSVIARRGTVISVAGFEPYEWVTVTKASGLRAISCSTTLLSLDTFKVCTIL